MQQDSDLASKSSQLIRLGSATIAESGGRALDPRLRPVWVGAGLCGPAYTVVCAPGDNLALHVAVTTAPRASVLVASVGDLPARGYWGEVLTVAASCAGLAGLVIDGCVRDTDTFEGHNFPVFTVGKALPGTTKDRGGKVGGEAMVGGVMVRTGDWILGDADGLALIDADRVDTVMGVGKARADKESKFFEALRSGSTTVQLMSLDTAAVEIIA